MAAFPRHAGWTLADALTAMALVAIAAALVLVLTGRSRDAARDLSCIQRLGRLAQAANQYANDFDKKFFYHWPVPDTTPAGSPGQAGGLWFDHQRAGRYLPTVEQVGPIDYWVSATRRPMPRRPIDAPRIPYQPHSPYSRMRKLVGPSMRCPTLDATTQPTIQRSYAMNYWATGAGAHPWSQAGVTFDRNSDQLAKLILFTEGYGYLRGDHSDLWFGSRSRPFERFAGRRRDDGTLFLPPLPSPTALDRASKERNIRQHLITWSLDYERHSDTPSQRLEAALRPVGRVNIAFADAHVTSMTSGQLYDLDTRMPTYAALWSPVDPVLTNNHITRTHLRQPRRTTITPIGLSPHGKGDLR